MTNKTIKLPPDLEEFTLKAKQKNNIRIALCALLFIVIACFLCINAAAIFRPENRLMRIFISLILLSVPFIVTGVPHKTSDKTYVGRVESIYVETTTGSNITGRYHNKSYNFGSRKVCNIICLEIVTPDGKRAKKKVYTAPANRNQAFNIYQIGDTVFHLYGTESVVVLPQKKHTHFECAVCEDVNDVKNTVCRACGHTLIKSEDSLFAAKDNYSEFPKIHY